MQRRHCVRTGRASLGATGFILSFCAAGIMQGAPARADDALAERVNEMTVKTQPSTGARAGQPSDYQPAFHLDYLHRGAAKDCQVPLPPIGAASPFPLALRLGAMISPRTKFDGGIDATIKGLHLLPNASSRVDLDAIVSVNFGGISTLVPLTFDQIFQLNLPVNSRVYLGGGVGPYFGDTTRFGGKLIAGAEFSRLGLEGNLHFSGTGAALFTIQARIGL